VTVAFRDGTRVPFGNIEPGKDLAQRRFDGPVIRRVLVEDVTTA
jgi:hypothetical protein